ncbi:MAG: hypothetical protein LW817_05220 [Candidatus Caenarcaniphilales bacterium]|jgi:hypothetical protein|nr:hypothetical protein [Candidatus Caenarcaniphilales bacterium]
MAEEEVVDAESSTLNKNATPLDHLKHLLNVGWDPKTPVIVKFVEKHSLYEDLQEELQRRNKG